MNKLKYLIIVFIGIVILTSCDDKLEVANPNAVDANTYWTDEDDIANGVVAAYSKFLNDGCFCRMGLQMLDVKGDDVIGHSSDNAFPLAGEFTILSTNDHPGWSWRDFYMVIYRVNLVLEHIDNVTFEDEEYKNRLLGQCYFLRGLSYYYITEMFQIAPLILQVQNTSDEYYPEANSREELIAQIETDLQAAMELLPESYDNVTGDDKGQTGRATWGAAAGFLARVYMMQYKWDDAETVLAAIIGADIYDLVDDYGDNFTYSNENNKESVFEVQFGIYGSTNNFVSYSSSDWIQGSGLGVGYGLGKFGGWSDGSVTWWLYHEFKKERTTDGLLDPRLYWTILSYEEEYDTYTDGRTNTVYGNSTYMATTLADTITVAKYTNARIQGGVTSEAENGYTASEINYRVIRYAEILLNYAEVLIVKGDYTNALFYINKIRDRAGLSIIEAGSISNDSVESQYHHQRSLELSIEALRYFDLKRWGWFYDNEKREILENRDEEFETWTTGKEYYPIYSGELSSNPNLVGNSNNNSTSNSDDYSEAFDWSISE